MAGFEMVPRTTSTRCVVGAEIGDPKKEEIAFAQTYFALQTRKAELIEQRMSRAVVLNCSGVRTIVTSHGSRLQARVDGLCVRDAGREQLRTTVLLSFQSFVQSMLNPEHCKRLMQRTLTYRSGAFGFNGVSTRNLTRDSICSWVRMPPCSFAKAGIRVSSTPSVMCSRQ